MGDGTGQNHQVGSMARSKYRQGEERLVAVIGDEDTVTGFLLAGVGDIDPRKNRGANFFIVGKATPLGEIENALRTMMGRPDIGIIVICQPVANDVRHVIAEHTAALPCILEVPGKGPDFDPSKDVVLQKLNRALGVAVK